MAYPGKFQSKAYQGQASSPLVWEQGKSSSRKKS